MSFRTIASGTLAGAHVVNLVANGMTPAQIVEELPDLQGMSAKPS